MEKATLGSQNLINALTVKKETLTVTSHVATLTYTPDAVVLVEAVTGSTTGGCNVILSGTVATGEAKLDRTAGTLTFFASDAVTSCYVEYFESVAE